MFTVRDLSELAAQLEKNGEKIYRRALAKVSDPGLVALLQWLADEEADHARWFADLAKSDRRRPVSDQLEKMGRQMMADSLKHQAFSLGEADFDKIVSKKQLIELAVEFEEDTVLFYNMLREFVDDAQALANLDIIIAEEQRHIKRLKAFLDQ